MKQAELKKIFSILIAALILTLWIPFSIPLILIGAMIRLGQMSVLAGYEITDDLLSHVSLSLYKSEKDKK